MNIHERVEHSFSYHAPNEDQKKRMAQLSDKAKELAHLILDLTPESREQSLAITNLDYARYCMNAAIIRNE